MLSLSALPEIPRTPPRAIRASRRVSEANVATWGGDCSSILAAFLLEEFCARVIVFMFAFAVSEAIALLERRVEYYAGAR